MLRPLASDGERETKSTDVHGVDNKRSHLGQALNGRAVTIGNGEI